jgi:5-methylcytosine-specific restriction endonuclease McrA
MPIDWRDYPKCWRIIRGLILARAGNRCEGAPEYPDCRAPNHQPHPVTGSHVVLTIAHLDHDPTNNTWDNLRALCQRCHLRHDLPQRVVKQRLTWERKRHPLLYPPKERRA